MQNDLMCLTNSVSWLDVGKVLSTIVTSRRACNNGTVADLTDVIPTNGLLVLIWQAYRRRSGWLWLLQ